MQAMYKPGCLLIVAVLPAFAAKAAEAPAVLPAEAFKSVFVSDPGFGKDPFFPKSTRRPLPTPRVETPATPQQPLVFESVQLKGISLATGRKLALLNYYTFAEGEEADLRIAGQVVHVRCLEIKERSVTVTVQGLRKELQLREGL
jgi:hypothetical protein